MQCVRGKTAKGRLTLAKGSSAAVCWKGHAAALVLIIATGIAAYSNSVQGSFHFDDLESIVENPSIRGLNPGKAWTGNNHFRFVGFYSFALNYHFGGLAAVREWHYVNIGLHILCALLLYGLLSFLAHDAQMPKSRIPLMASLLFATHPLCSEPVNYIQARHVLFYSLFCLSGVLSTILFVRAGSMKRKIIPILAVGGSILLGAMSKEAGIFYLPAAIGAYLLVFRLAEGEARRLSRVVMVSSGTVAVIVFIMITNWMRPLSMRAQRYYHATVGETCFVTNLLTQAQIFWRYVSLLIPLSSRLNVDHHVRIVRLETLGQMLTAVLPVLCMVAAVTVAFRRKARNPILAFLVLWSILGVLPYMLVLSSAELMVEYKVYLAAMGFMGLVALCFERAAEFISNRWSYRHVHMIPRIVFAILLIFCVKETRSRNQIWHSELTLWNDAIMKSPMKARPYYNRGVAYGEEGECDKAISDFGQALKINPEHAKAYYNRGVAHGRKGERDKAMWDYDHALSIDPNYAEAHNNRGAIYGRKGEYAKAISDLSQALRINSSYAEAYNNRGAIYGRKGEYAKAISDLSQALRINPNYAKAYYSRGTAYFLKKQYDKAWDDIRRARSLGHQVNQDSWKNFAKLLEVGNDTKRQKKH